MQYRKRLTKAERKQIAENTKAIEILKIRIKKLEQRLCSHEYTSFWLYSDTVCFSCKNCDQCKNVHFTELTPIDYAIIAKVPSYYTENIKPYLDSLKELNKARDEVIDKERVDCGV